MSNPIKPTIKSEIIPLLLIIITAVSAFYFYNNFPERVPIHWNVAGEVDNWGSRTFAALLMPLIIIGMYLLFLVIPYLDPKKDRYDQFRKVYHAFKNFMILFMVAIYFITGFNALGYDISVSTWIPALVGLLFIIIGNYMGKIKPNWFMGIRTPWTLSSEEVWNKTHRFGGKIFIIAGIAMVLMGIIPVNLRMPLFIVMIVLILVGTVGYSYFIYSKEQKNKKHEKNN